MPMTLDQGPSVSEPKLTVGTVYDRHTGPQSVPSSSESKGWTSHPRTLVAGCPDRVVPGPYGGRCTVETDEPPGRSGGEQGGVTVAVSAGRTEPWEPSRRRPAGSRPGHGRGRPVRTRSETAWLDLPWPSLSVGTRDPYVVGVSFPADPRPSRHFSTPEPPRARSHLGPQDLGGP